MACMKLGSKTDAFQRKGQAWFCNTGLPSDIVVEVEEMSFHLHKFSLLSRSGVMERSIAESSEDSEEGCAVKWQGLEKMVRELMEGEMGKEVRNNVGEFGEAAKKAMKEGGTSWHTLNQLIDKLQALRGDSLKLCC